MVIHRYLTSIENAVTFAQLKHEGQLRHDGVTPYIVHPIEVAELLFGIAGVRDNDILSAAVLHDTIEDTATTADELRTTFGDRVLSLVLECSDDKTLPKAERKRLQVVQAPRVSDDAKLIKIADKISNLRSLVEAPPRDWSHQRRVDYVAWSEAVFAGLRGGNPALDSFFEQTRDKTRLALAQCDLC